MTPCLCHLFPRCLHTVTPDAVFSYVYKAMALYQKYDVLSIGQQQVGAAGRDGLEAGWLVPLAPLFYLPLTACPSHMPLEHPLTPLPYRPPLHPGLPHQPRVQQQQHAVAHCALPSTQDGRQRVRCALALGAAPPVGRPLDGKHTPHLVEQSMN